MKKIGEIKGVPVVEGNVNEVTKNQIHYKEDSGSIQLSKRGNDNKLNSVTGSSSTGDGGIEVCYYKRIDDAFDIQYDNILGMICRLVNVIDRIVNKGNVLVYNSIHPMSGEELPLAERLSVCVGFCMIKEETLTNQVGGQFSLVPKGNMIDKLNYFINSIPSDEPEINEFKQLLNYVNSTYQEITKEEYESMITYKPE